MPRENFIPFVHYSITASITDMRLGSQWESNWNSHSNKHVAANGGQPRGPDSHGDGHFGWSGIIYDPPTEPRQARNLANADPFPRLNLSKNSIALLRIHLC